MQITHNFLVQARQPGHHGIGHPVDQLPALLVGPGAIVGVGPFSFAGRFQHVRNLTVWVFLIIGPVKAANETPFYIPPTKAILS
jgi:hypothetical protein